MILLFLFMLLLTGCSALLPVMEKAVEQLAIEEADIEISASIHH